MLISEAILHLQSYGVTQIVRVPNPTCQVWRVTQNGEDYLYASELERVVWALSDSDDWE